MVGLPSQSDATAALEKDYGYKDDHFTFIQQHLRRICLKCTTAHPPTHHNQETFFSSLFLADC